MANHKHHSNEQIVACYVECGCNKTTTAETLGMSRANLHYKILNNSDLRDMIMDAEESLLDHAEGELQKLITDGDYKAVRFFLERKGRKRGYGNTIELTGDSERPLRMITKDMTPAEAAQAYADTLKRDPL